MASDDCQIHGCGEPAYGRVQTPYGDVRLCEEHITVVTAPEFDRTAVLAPVSVFPSKGGPDAL
jgi:hypothetical protein